MNENLTEKDTDFPAPDVGVRSIPKVSVIVPVYKVEKYLPECIESILAQTFKDFELILVDDGSPDNSGKICDDYAARDSRIRVFHKKNGGVSSARNLGLDNALGEWIAFVDSDDTVGRKYLEHLFSEDIDGNVLVVSGLINVSEKGEITRCVQFPAETQSPVAAFREKMLYKYGYPVSKLYNNRLIRTHGIRFDPEISMAEDMLFMADYLLFSKFVVFRSDCRDYLYWFRDGSLSKQFSTFESEFKLFLRGREVFEKLVGTSLLLGERDINRRSFFRAINRIYRPPFFKKALRFHLLKYARSMLREEDFKKEDCSFRERIFMRGSLLVFDSLSVFLFGLRYGLCESFWEACCSWRRRRLANSNLNAMDAR